MKKSSPRWNDGFYVKSYELARTGLPDPKIAQSLGVTPATFSKWKSENSFLQEALIKGRKESRGSTKKGESLASYIYNKLPKHLQETWERINSCVNHPNGVEKVEYLLSLAGKQARQHLFVYALVHANFNASEACKSVNITKRTLDAWTMEDPNFSQLVDEIHFHKQNFYESALIEKVKEGDSACVIFANRTLNKDRGYSESLKIQGEVEHTHTHLDVTVEDILPELPIEVCELILDKMKERREKLKAQANPVSVQMLAYTS